MKVSNTVYYLFYAAITLTTAFLCNHLLGHDHLHYPFSTTNWVLQHDFGQSDPGSFSRGGWLFFTTGWQGLASSGILQYWPPGFMTLQAMILKIFGANAPIVAILQMLAALLLAVALNLFRLLLAFFVKNSYAVCLPLTLLLFSQFTIFMLSQDGVVLGETFAISCVFIGFLCVLLAYARHHKGWAIAAGVSFALSCYCRSHYDIFFIIATLNFFCIATFIYLYQKIKGRLVYAKNTPNPLTMIFITLIILHSATLPYRVYNHIHSHTFSWVQTQRLNWQDSFTPSATLMQLNRSFLLIGGANIACLLDQDKCNRLYPQINNGSIHINTLRLEVLKTCFSHFSQWVALKIKLMPRFWFGALAGYWELVVPHTFSFLQNSIYLGCVLLTLLMTALTLRNAYSLITFWLSSSISMAFVTIFMLAHFEARYFLFFKFYFLLTAIFSSCQLLQNRRLKRTWIPQPTHHNIFVPYEPHASPALAPYVSP